MITADVMKEKCKEFEERVGRLNFYDLAFEIRKSHPLQAAVITLAIGTYVDLFFGQIWRFKEFR